MVYIYVALKASELILNEDGSVYHLALCPEDIATTIILVGDPNRVHLVSDHFDRIDVKKQKREFVSHTGWLNDHAVTVLSTGIGTDNIDIVLNELDALVNVDFATRKPKEKLTSLNIIRIGTSGSIHPDVGIDEFLVSRYAIGTDSLAMYYGHHTSVHAMLPPWSYMTKGYNFNLSKFSLPYKEGITLTCPGFYAAQGRHVRLMPEFLIPVDQLHHVQLEGFPITNMEMETSAIYLLSDRLGHKAISFNAILAHRLDGTFSKLHDETVRQLIREVLKCFFGQPDL